MVNIEECLKNVGNRFELTNMASRRAYQLLNGASPMVDVQETNAKATVIALQEIATGYLFGEKTSTVP